MKLSKIFHRKHTIAGRLTWRVVGTMTAVMTLILVLIFTFLWLLGAVLFATYIKSSMRVSNEKINNVFSTVEVAVSNNTPEVEENIDNDQRQYFAVEHLLKLNPNIMGAAVAYNPECPPHKGEALSPYAYRDSMGIHTKQLNTPEYDYLHQEWYTKPIEQGKGTWSEPYIDEGGGEVAMITYSQPIINNNGEIYAIQTADIALNWLNDLMHELDSTTFSNLYFIEDEDIQLDNSFIVTRKGTFVAHPDPKMLLNKTLYDLLKTTNRDDIDIIAQKILTSDNGYTGFRDSLGQRQILFHSSIEHTGWTMITIFPLKATFSPITVIIGFLFILMIIGLIIVALICRSAIRRVTKPIRKFADSADEIASGNFAAELPTIKTKDEMLRLHNSFKTMQKSLIRQIEETKSANEEKGRIESELNIARGIQMSMLPKTFPPFPDRNDVEIYGQQNPAKEVGGDLYDFYIRDEKLFFCIGDVSGKGVPASLVMAVTRTLFRTISFKEAQPERIMYGINNAMADNNESNMFVTLFIGVLDLPTGRLRYSNGGHNAPLLIGQTIGLLPCAANVPLGVMPDWKFNQQETTIDINTCIFLYTDGLTEAENMEHDQFLEERMIDVAKASTHQPQQLIEQMINAVHEFVGDAEQSDDLTMLAIQYTKPQEKDVKLQRSITLPNDIDEVPKLATFVDEVCEIVGFDMSTAMSLNLALEEAVVNVMSYAYPSGTTGNVNIEAMANDKRLKFIICDWGTPFDPTAEKEVDTTLSAEERPIGGLGIHLVRQIMDSINYERIDGMNVLTLRKKLV
jgi:sigma-B regulation protein RsbU (phosphoserine phosphatase)